MRGDHRIVNIGPNEDPNGEQRVEIVDTTGKLPKNQLRLGTCTYFIGITKIDF